ncbi:hypothetical protein GQ53DRAFT_803714 [Thozetella sp. PMI_491]|nr:hypothetical protein GQ53DRAFT_803714 [Thozetella sp. PMI_491]
MAAWNGNAALMHWLLERGADPGHEAFLAAIVKGHMGALRILLEANARVGTSVGSWSFMLKYAIRLDRNQIFRYLVEDLNVLDTVAECIDDHAPIWSLLYLSCTHDNIEALDLLIQSGMPTDVSLAWSRIGDFGFVQYHTENVFLHSESIHTPMELAISHNATKVTRRLEKMDRTRMGMRYDRVVCVTEDEPNRFPPKHKIMGIPLPGNFDTMSWFSEALDDEG